MYAMYKRLDDYWFDRFVNPDAVERYASVESTEIEAFGNYLVTRGVAKILTELEIPGYTESEIKKIRFPVRTTVEQQPLTRNQKLKRRLAELEKRMAGKS